MSAVPLSPPAGGDEDNSQMLRAVVWVEACLGGIVMIARLSTRGLIAKNLGWDDFWMVVTWILALITNCLTTIGLHYGIARHLYYLSHESASKALKMDWLSHAPAIGATSLGKVAFSIFLLRIIPKTKRWMRWSLHGQNALLVVINIPLIIITYVQCDPVAGLWNPTIGAKCWPPHIQADYAQFQGAYGVLTDLVLALFPLFIIWDLQVSKKVKRGLAVLMCLGVFAAGCAVAKTYHLHLMTHRTDFTWESQYMTIWFTTEMYAIIIAATVPTLRPLFLWATNRTVKNNYQPYNENHFGMSGLRSRPARRGTIEEAKGGDDSASSILHLGNIQKTTDINVTFDEASSRKDKALECTTSEVDRRSVHVEDNV